MAKKEKKSGKSSKDQLADGAAAIKKAAADKAAAEPIVLEPLTRSVEEIVRDRVTILEGSIGLELSSDTTIEESLAVLGYATALSDHVGFMIGDVLNFGESKWGQKYAAALNQTGYAKSTLKGYAEAAKRIPAAKRQASLTFSQHREILRLPDEKMDTVLKEVGKQAEKKQAPTVAELRLKIQKLTPRKKKTPKKATSGKGKKTGKKATEAPPYQPTDEEQAKLDQAEEALSTARDAVKSAKLYQIVARLDNKEKKRWLEMTETIHTFYLSIERVTGY